MRRKAGSIVLIDFGLSKQYNSQGEPETSTAIGYGTPGSVSSTHLCNYNQVLSFKEENTR